MDSPFFVLGIPPYLEVKNERNLRIIIMEFNVRAKVVRISLLLCVLAICGCFSHLMGCVDLYQAMLGKIGLSLGSRALSVFLIKSSGGLALAIVIVVRMAFLATEDTTFISQNMMDNHSGWTSFFGTSGNSEASVNQEQHQPSRPGTSAPIQNGSASTSSVEQPAPPSKPYIALLQLEGERKRLLDDIIDFVQIKLEDPRQPLRSQGRMYEQSLRLLWNELEIDESTSLGELQYWKDSLRENPQQYNSIFGFYKPGGIFSEGNTPPGYKTR